MKKWIKGLTVLCATTTLYTGCGTSKEDALLEKTQKVYENVDDAHNSVKKYANDIYNGCKAYVLQGENLTVEDFLDETNIIEDEMLDAMKAYFVEKFGEDQAEELIRSADDDEYTSLVLLRSFSGTLGPAGMGIIIENVYSARGTTEDIQDKLDTAKNTLKEIDSDYEYYASLKDYYTTVSSYYDFCEHLTGTFEQMQDTITGYENDIRKDTNDLKLAIDE